MPEVKEKRCNKCHLLKPVKDFSKDKKSPDGYGYTCKTCKSLYAKECYQRERPNSKAGLDSWDQIDSVVREIAEIQAAINAEKATCERRIAQLKEYVNKAIRPWQAHQERLIDMLREYFKKNHTDTVAATKDCRFGTVGYFGGRIILDLNTELAKERIDKP